MIEHRCLWPQRPIVIVETALQSVQDADDVLSCSEDRLERGSVFSTNRYETKKKQSQMKGAVPYSCNGHTAVIRAREDQACTWSAPHPSCWLPCPGLHFKGVNEMIRLALRQYTGRAVLWASKPDQHLCMQEVQKAEASTRRGEGRADTRTDPCMYNCKPCHFFAGLGRRLIRGISRHMQRCKPQAKE